ncbi:UNVERIFIED_CONTAM: hypothetical protein GTU68_065913, partial [Idotea baltica]|nr:hypothetical protein [Idotea baltica]
MVNDKPRTEAYRDAIKKNEHLFKGKVVMDVGAGTGVLSLFIADAGAKKVYSIEASNLANSIPAVAKQNGFSDVIEAFHTRVEDFKLPADQKVDVIVSEWMGFYLFHESMLSSVIYARENFLSDEGTIFPSEARLYACPCSMENFYEDRFYFWENVYGFNMSVIEECAFKAKL